MTTTPRPNDWQTTVRERLLSRAGSEDWSALWPEVVRIRLDVLSSISGVSDEQAAWKPEAGDWSIAETVRHLLPSSAGVISIIEELAAGRVPGADTPYDSPGDLTAHEVTPEFDGSFELLRAALRDDAISFAALPGRLPADPDLDRTFPHMYFGELPARAWFAFQRIHDGAHLSQLRAIIGNDRYPR